MNNDSHLLRRYVEEKSERAFTELVQRHIGLVYSVALRRVGGDPHLAEDVAQKVFSDLARKAHSLTGHATLSGWLFAAAHHASAALVRSERRRKARETEAHIMDTTLSPAGPAGADPDWTRLRPVLDEVIIALKNDDREAIALRFLEKRSFAEVGAALRVTEDAARKRVDRALEKLRTLLARHGVTSTATALGLALAAAGPAAIPSGLATKIAGTAFANATASASGSIAGTAATTLWPAVAALVLGGFLIGSQSRTNDRLQAEVARLSAENNSLATMRADIRQLGRTLAQVDDLRRILAEPPPRAPSAIAASATPRAIAAQVTVNPNGTLTWNREPVKLHDFIARLRALQTTGDPESRVHISGLGANYSALVYVIDEVRKAQLNHVTVESNATPDLKFGWSWFQGTR